MNDLIEALQIFSKYISEDTYNPTHCEHDKFMVMAPENVSKEDRKRLDELSFFWNDDCWNSFRFGSC